MTTILLYLLTGMSALSGVAGSNALATDAPFRSVELGLAEVSPIGEAGGYAVPASGSSYNCSLDLNPDSASAGDSVVASWTHGAGTIDSGGLLGFIPGFPSTITQYFDVALYRCNSGTSCTGNPAGGSAGLCQLLGNCPSGNWTQVGQKSDAASPGTFTTGTTGLTNGDYLYRLVTTEHSNTHAHSEMCDATLEIAGGLTASCSVSPTTTEIGDSVTWTASASGGTGSYTYQWQGTDSLTGSTASVNKSYNTAGIKTGRVRVTSGSQISNWINCSNSVNVSAADPVTLDLTADEYLIDSGDSTILRWDTTNADYCTTSNGWSGNRVPDSSQSTGPLTEDTTYNMICYNDDGQSSNPDSVTVRIREIVGIIEPCDDNYVVRQGEEFCMEYEVDNPNQCVIRLGQNEIEGPLTSTTGQFTWSLNSQGTFTLYCDGEIDSATIRVLPEFQET